MFSGAGPAELWVQIHSLATAWSLAAGPNHYTRPSVGTGCPGRTGVPSRHARNGAGARTCPAMPRQSVVERSRIAFSMKVFLETAPIDDENPASSWRKVTAGGPSRPYVSWDRGTERHAPVPTRPYLCCFSASLALAEAPLPQAVVTTAKEASGCVMHTSTNPGWPRRQERVQPR